MKRFIITIKILLFMASTVSHAQDVFEGYVFTNPFNITAKSYNIGVQLQSSEAPKFAISGGLNHRINNKNSEDYSINFETKVKNFEVKFFPYGKQQISFKKKKRYPGICNDKYGCSMFGKNIPFYQKLLRGVYVAGGYENQQSVLTLTPKKELNDPITKRFTINNKAITLSTGIQCQLSAFFVGASYRASFGKPTLNGGNKIIEQELYTHTFPTAFRLEHGLNIDFGFKF